MKVFDGILAAAALLALQALASPVAPHWPCPPPFLLGGGLGAWLCDEPWFRHCPCARANGGGGDTMITAPAPPPATATVPTGLLPTVVPTTTATVAPVGPVHVCPEFIVVGHPCTEPELRHCPCAAGLSNSATQIATFPGHGIVPQLNTDITAPTPHVTLPVG